jgi:hypothetical protein
MDRPYFLALLAEVQSTMGQLESGLAAVGEAMAMIVQGGRGFFYEAELQFTPWGWRSSIRRGGGMFWAGARHRWPARGKIAGVKSSNKPLTALEAARQERPSAAAGSRDL